MKKAVWCLVMAFLVGVGLAGCTQKPLCLFHGNGLVNLHPPGLRHQVWCRALDDFGVKKMVHYRREPA